MRCGQCDKTTGVIFNSLPAKVKCSIDNELHKMNEQCSIEFVPLKHAKWEYDVETAGFKCTNCGKRIWGMTLEIASGDINYCPNCGAKMDEAAK